MLILFSVACVNPLLRASYCVLPASTYVLLIAPSPSPLWIILVGLAEAFDDRVQIISC